MEPRKIAEQVRQLIAQAETEEALRVLLEYLPTEKRWSELKQAAAEAQAQFLNAKREANGGRITFDQADLIYNRVNNAVYQIADDLENGITRLTPAQQTRRMLPYLAIAIGAVAIAFLGYWVSQQGGEDDPADTQQTQTGCPDFEAGDSFKILLWEYDSFNEDNVDSKKLPVALQNRLSSIDRDGLLQTGIYTLAENQKYPLRKEQALQCEAQLSLWGTTDKVNENQWIVITNFAFAKPWQLKRWGMSPGDDWEKSDIAATLPLQGVFVDTISSLSSVFTEGKISTKVEQLLQIAIGLNATLTSDQNGAVATLESFESQDSTLALLGGMLLADNYTRMGKEEQALAAYEKVLSVHPNYALALNNYAALQIKKGNYGEAIATLDNAATVAPKNADVLAMRGSAYLAVNQLDKAQKDFSKAQELTTNKAAGTEARKEVRSKVIEQKVEELNVRVQQEKQRRSEAEQQLKVTPENVEALNTRADASKNLGDHKTAIQSANEVIKMQPDNVKAHTILVESLTALGDTARVRTALTRAEKIGIAPAEIKENAPLIRSLTDTTLFRRRFN
ncbi:MAG TPA: tetratricopeptide repeat protein [Saprospiraceae bacterium]|nr:tetratricopeptide repeat protein [Saprospiraceae bacterium]HRK83889.1 tetratricopeptide repeat protein [Saprospiraceae bacterium]